VIPSGSTRTIPEDRLAGRHIRTVDYETLLYSVADAVATITLHRPARLNTILPPMPEEFEAAVRRATVDGAVKVIVVGAPAGRSAPGTTSPRGSTTGTT
jgi:1,4-dihydroxy-2-naphthoyl-CoA synthase